MSDDAWRRSTPVCRLRDYTPPAWQVTDIDLHFDLDLRETVVTSRMQCRRTGTRRAALQLDGRELDLVSVRVDDAPLNPVRLRRTEAGLELDGLPAECSIEIVTRLHPDANRSMMGLYLTSGVLVTQCEPEGFRRITYFPDRPDVMARYSVTLVDRSGRLPVLLSNGNVVAEGVDADGCRYTSWRDPHAKPSYLFAIAAGDLVSRRRRIVQREHVIELAVHAPPDLVDRSGLALDTLARAIDWDREIYGRDYDLDVLNLVVVRDFEGAMENKGLLLAGPMLALFDPRRSTDWDRMVIENNLSHEYLHNWTGNRITCRDWFQLGLKEGLTTFRHWQFSERMGLPAMKRIWQARLYVDQVFPEESGARAHPVRPEEYGDISNFYTATVYKKGAEIPRMLLATLGPGRFRRGMDRFFRDCDGRAVTFEDWLTAMSLGSGEDLSAFGRWYRTVGSPRLTVNSDFDAAARRCTLRLTQTCPHPRTGEEQGPLPVPVAFGLIGSDGQPLAFRLAGEPAASPDTRIVLLVEATMTLTLHDVAARPIPSLLRGFSAPVHLETSASAAERRVLALHDPDLVARWHCLQDLLVEQVLAVRDAVAAPRATAAVDDVAELFRAVLDDASVPDLVRYELLQLPELVSLRERRSPVDMRRLDGALREVRLGIARLCRADLERGLRSRPPAPYRADPASMGARRVRNLCLGFLAEHFPEDFAPEALGQLRGADNMSDSLGALEALCHVQHVARDEALAWFEARWSADAEVMDKWLQAQARSRRPDALARVIELTRHPAFDYRSPGRVRALLRTFAMDNPGAVHGDDGAGYAFLVDQQIILDRLGEKTAAWSHLLDEFALLSRMPRPQGDAMRGELERLLATPGIAAATREQAARCLDAAGIAA